MHGPASTLAPGAEEEAAISGPRAVLHAKRRAGGAGGAGGADVDWGWAHFAGYMEKAEAEALLSDKPTGTFLLRRVPARGPAYVTLSYVRSPGKFMHAEVTWVSASKAAKVAELAAAEAARAERGERNAALVGGGLGSLGVAVANTSTATTKRAPPTKVQVPSTGARNERSTFT